MAAPFEIFLPITAVGASVLLRSMRGERRKHACFGGGGGNEAESLKYLFGNGSWKVAVGETDGAAGSVGCSERLQN